MKQILQNLKTGETEVCELPCPALPSQGYLIRTNRTLISAGTERMLVEFGKAGLIDKARQQPDKVKQVLQKMGTDGIGPTLEAVRNKLDQPLPLGYSNVGRILKRGDGATALQPGDRVVSNGHHAQMVAVPENLCAKIPDGVSDDDAAFTVLGAIALQGIRLVAPTLGETVMVSGLGLIGLLTVQLLRANGCRVIGSDFDPVRLKLARRFGADTVDLGAGADPVRAGLNATNGVGVDAAIITASTKSSDPITQAAQMSRKRGRIVLVGVTGLSLCRADFYEKELTFQVSCSYGPGRYDQNYERNGMEYPIGFVRWTEQRNFQAVLGLMADGKLDLKPLISHRFSITDASKAYEIVGSSDPSLGVLLDYPQPADISDDEVQKRSFALPSIQPSHRDGPLGLSVGFIGSGNYAGSVLIPAFKKAGARLTSIASATGVSGFHAGRKHGFARTTTDPSELIADQDIGSVVIATRHDSHAELVTKALAAGKHVFVEKPLALTENQLISIIDCYHEMAKTPAAPQLMVGFNRRFAPQVQKIETLLKGAPGPKAMVMTVNAGHIPMDHWTQDATVGGGGIIGEGCHFIDLLRHLAGHPIERCDATRMASDTGDTVTLSLLFQDGTIGTVHYFANGHNSIAKERLEIFASGRVLQLNNFRKLTGTGWNNFTKQNLPRQDKGQGACVQAFLKATQGGAAPIPFDQLVEVARVTIKAS